MRCVFERELTSVRTRIYTSTNFFNTEDRGRKNARCRNRIDRRLKKPENWDSKAI
jgi:hypothetical protein